MARKQGSHSDITGPRIRAAALALFAQEGFVAVSVRRIATEVGVQAGALYNYFPDKQSLLFDLLQSHMAELLTEVKDVPGAAPPQDRLDAFTRFHIRFHLPRRDLVFISHMELRNLSGENFARIESMRSAYEDVLEGILQDGLDAGAFKVAEPRVTTRALIALLTGITNWYRPEGRLSIAEIEAIYVGLVRQAVTA